MFRSRLHSNRSQTLPQMGQGLFLATCCALVALLLPVLAPVWTEGVERSALDSMFRLRGTRYPHSQIVIVTADDETVQRYKRGWPLPRNIYTQVVQKLQRAGAKTIAFDIVFTGASSAPDDEQKLRELGAACRDTGRVVHGSSFLLLQRRGGNSAKVVAPPPPPGTKLLASRFSIIDKGAPGRSFDVPSFPHPVLRDSAGMGHVNVDPDQDGAGTLRKIPHLVRYRGAVYPSVALAAATNYLGLKPQDVVGVPGAVLVGNTRVPLDNHGGAWINWVGGNWTYPTVKFHELLDSKRSDAEWRELFRDCVVLVGVTAAGAYEHRATPFSNNQPAVELQANALDDILSRRPLREASPIVERAVLLGFLLLIGALITGRSAWKSFFITFGFSMALLIGAVLAMARADYYLPIAMPLLGAALLVGSATSYRQLKDARSLRIAEERYALAVRGANDGIWDWNLEEGEVYFSPRWKEMLGYSLEEVGTSPDEWFLRVHPDDVQGLKGAIAAHLEGRYPHFESEYRIKHQDGTYHWMLCRGLKVQGENGRNGRVRTPVARTAAEAQIVPAATAEVMNGTAPGAVVPDAVVADGVTAGRADGTVALTAGSARRGDVIIDAVPVATAQSGEVPSGTMPESRDLDALDFAAFGASRMAGSQTDITARKRAQDELLHNALHDRLTDLPNRVLFMERLGRAIAHGKRRPEYRFAVLFIDIDRFKVVNDSLGHMVGDELLKAVAQRLVGCLRPADTAARLGGDEFTLLLDEIGDVSDATRVAERFQKELSKPFDLNGHEVAPTASIGIVISVSDTGKSAYEQPDDMLRDADIAMYRAKALGRSRHAVFDEAMHARALALLRLETDLRRALERQNLRVYYQPIVSLETGRISGFEALARWQHPERGLIPPGEFIGLAEETGLIIPIDQWVLREACSQAMLWQERYPAAEGDAPLSISVNLSSKQFTQAGMVSQIDTIIRETGIRPGDLKLEITESVLMENSKSAAEMLLELKALGIRLSIDDFGTGYSSLSYLHEFALDVLKIDQSFVGRMGGEEDHAQIVETIVTLAHNMKMQVIAEGVETADQLARLRGLACDYGQGYFFSRPLDSEAAGSLLSRHMQW